MGPATSGWEVRGKFLELSLTPPGAPPCLDASQHRPESLCSAGVVSRCPSQTCVPELMKLEPGCSPAFPALACAAPGPGSRPGHWGDLNCRSARSKHFSGQVCPRRRRLRVHWTSRRSNWSILKEINPEYSLEGLKLKLQYFGHLIERTDSLETTLVLGKIEGRRRRG